MLETSNFVHGSAMRSLSFVVSEFSLSGRGQGHVRNFYIVDLEYFVAQVPKNNIGYGGTVVMKYSA